MNIAEGVLLSSWNCILGPKVECLWLPEFNLHESASLCNLICSSADENIDSSNFNKYVANDCKQGTHDNLHPQLRMCLGSSSRMQNSAQIFKIKKVLKICGQLLIGEAEQNQFLQSKSRLFMSEDSHLIITSVLFYKTPCLSAGKPCGREGVWFCIALFFKFSQLKTVLDMKYMIDFCLRRAADAIKMSDPQRATSKEVSAIMQDLFSSVNHLTGCSQELEQVSLAEVYNNAENLDFICKAVSSHLQTSCVSVVIGDCEHLISQVIHVLKMFSDEKEKYYFHYDDQNNVLSFINGLSVQGYLADINQAVNMLSKLETYQNPITIIDATNQIVQKFHISKDHDIEENRCSLEIVTESGILVCEILEKILLLLKNGKSSPSLVNEFCKSFKIKAATLLKIIRKSRAFGIPSRSELMTVLGLHEIADFQVILGCAEKLRPGIRRLIL